MIPKPRETPSPMKIAWASVAAFVVAAVLPAEYGLDPLGTGKAFGLLALSRVQPVATESAEYKTDVLELQTGSDGVG